MLLNDSVSLGSDIDIKMGDTIDQSKYSCMDGLD